jgi:hypothetical protein
VAPPIEKVPAAQIVQVVVPAYPALQTQVVPDRVPCPLQLLVELVPHVAPE